MTRRLAALLLALLLVAVAAPGGARAQGAHAVFSRDGLDVWAVGDSGRYYRSYDGGLGWTYGNLGGRTLRGVAARGLRVLVVGDSGKIFRSADNGGTWTSFGATGVPAMRSVALPTDLDAWAVGDAGVIFRTSDGGVGWSPQSSGTAARLNAVHFTSAAAGWVVGDGGFVAKTTDGGALWTPVPVGTTQNLFDVDVRGTTVWVVGAGGAALRSTDGGTQWNPVNLKLDARSDVRAVWLQSPDTVLVAGGGGFIRRSLDGGATWSWPQHAQHGQISGLAFAGPVGFAASNRNRVVLRTTNVGATWSMPTGATLKRSWWQKYTTTQPVRGATLTFNPKNPNTLYAMIGTQVFRSGDEGETWQSQGLSVPNSDKANAFVVSPKDSNLFLAAVGLTSSGDADDRVVRSVDGGQSWTTELTQAFGEYGIPLEVHPDRPDTVYFGGDGSVLHRSTDFGDTWSTHGVQVFSSPCDLVVVPDSGNVIVVGDGITGSGRGRIYNSTNNGTSFTERWINPNMSGGSEVPGLSCSRLDKRTLVATAWSNGGIQRSIDYGTSWLNVSGAQTTWGTDIAKDDPNLVMVGRYSGGRSHLSLDGGATFSDADTTHLPNANYSFLLRDRGLILAEQNTGIWKMKFVYAFTPTSAQSVTLSAPNGGESWMAGTVHAVTWSAANVGLARIEYRTGPAQPWILVADVAGYLGSYAWTVPNTPTAQAQVRVSDAWDASPTDASNATFTITGAAVTLALTAPNGGEVWSYGTGHAVTWSSTGIDSVALDLQLEPSGPWLEVVPTTPAASGSWSWTIPDQPSVLARIRVRQRGGANEDAGDAAFQITVPRFGASFATHDFGPTPLGAVNTTALWMNNIGTAPLTAASVTSDNPRFRGGRTAFVLAAGDDDTLGISFAPTAIGPDTAFITFATDDPAAPHVIRVTGVGTADTGSDQDPPVAFALAPNQPNPFTRATSIAYALPVEAEVALEVFDLRGRLVATLVRGVQPAGRHTIPFAPDALGEGHRLRSGIYLVRLRAGAFTATRKILRVQ